MRVDLRTYGLAPPEDKKMERAGQTASTDKQGTETAALDQARFSFDQARVKSLEAEALALPEVREQKVELLRQLLGKGEYAVHEGQIADAIIADLAPGSAGQRAG